MNIPSVINPSYVVNLDKKITSVQNIISKTGIFINTCKTCSELSTIKNVSDEIMTEFNKSKKIIEDFFTDQITEVLKTINKLEPLLTPPTDLGSVISWITNSITTFQEPYTKALILQTQLLEKQIEFVGKLSFVTSNINSLQNSIIEKASILKCNL